MYYAMLYYAVLYYPDFPVAVGGNHLSNTTCLTLVFVKTGE